MFAKVKPEVPDKIVKLCTEDQLGVTLFQGQILMPLMEMEEEVKLKFFELLTLINAAYFHNNLTRRGAQSSSPSNRPKNQGLRKNYGRILKYRQLLLSREKKGSIRPKLGPYRRNQNFGQNVEF